MYWLFCLSGSLYYFRHPTTCVHVADEYTSGHGLHVVCCWLLLMYLAALGWCSVYLSVWLYQPTAREEELTAW